VGGHAVTLSGWASRQRAWATTGLRRDAEVFVPHIGQSTGTDIGDALLGA